MLQGWKLLSNSIHMGMNLLQLLFNRTSLFLSEPGVTHNTAEGIKGSTDIAPISHMAFLHHQIICEKLHHLVKNQCNAVVLKGHI